MEMEFDQKICDENDDCDKCPLFEGYCQHLIDNFENYIEDEEGEEDEQTLPD